MAFPNCSPVARRWDESWAAKAPICRNSSVS